MATPRPNPETVEALLDTTWRMSANEAARTDALDRKASTLGMNYLRRFPTWSEILKSPEQVRGNAGRSHHADLGSREPLNRVSN